MSESTSRKTTRNMDSNGESLNYAHREIKDLKTDMIRLQRNMFKKIETKAYLYASRSWTWRLDMQYANSVISWLPDSAADHIKLLFSKRPERSLPEIVNINYLIFCLQDVLLNPELEQYVNAEWGLEGNIHINPMKVDAILECYWYLVISSFWSIGRDELSRRRNIRRPSIHHPRFQMNTSYYRWMDPSYTVSE